jgi:hypothetical protein
MKLLGLDGKEYIYNFKKICREVENPSSLHLSARAVIKKTFGLCSIYEEVQLLGSRLVADFFIPDMKVMIEVHGQQHYKFVKQFHKTEAGFIRSKIRDVNKKEWCDINEFSYIELPFDKIDSWKNIIEEYI